MKKEEYVRRERGKKTLNEVLDRRAQAERIAYIQFAKPDIRISAAWARRFRMIASFVKELWSRLRGVFEGLAIGASCEEGAYSLASSV